MIDIEIDNIYDGTNQEKTKLDRLNKEGNNITLVNEYIHEKSDLDDIDKALVDICNPCVNSDNKIEF